MEEWLQTFAAWLPEGSLYYGLIGLISFLESLAVVGIFVPGSVLIVFAGFLAAHGKGDPALLMAVAAFGALAGDLLSYWLGGHLSSRLQSTVLFRKRQGLLIKARDFFNAHGGKSVFFGRFIGLLRPFIPFVAGSAGMAAWRFLLYALISAVLWGLAYPGLGYFFGTSWQMVKIWTGRFSFLVAILLILIVLNTLFWRRFIPFFIRGCDTMGKRFQGFGSRLLTDQRVQNFAAQHPKFWTFFTERFNPHRGFGLYLTLGFLFTGLFSALFFRIVQEVFLRTPLIRIDLRVYELMQEFHHPVSDTFFLISTYLGSLPVLLILTGLVLFWLMLYNRDFSSVILLAGVIFGQGLVFFLKYVFERPRPAPFFPELAPLSVSFPSVHAFNSLLFYGLLVYFLLGAVRPWRMRFALAFIASFLAMVIGFSRIYLGLHWASDVLGGFALAAVWLTVLITASEMRRRGTGEFPWLRGWRPVSLNRTWRLVILTPVTLSALAGAGLYIQERASEVASARNREETIRVLPETTTPEELATRLPLFTEDLGGNPERPLSMVLFADQTTLIDTLLSDGWEPAAPTGLTSFLNRTFAALQGSTHLRSAALPHLVQGKTQDMTLVNAPHEGQGRKVLLLWKFPLRLTDGRTAWGLSVSYHPGNRKLLGVPLPLPLLQPQIDRQRDLLLDTLRDAGAVEKWTPHRAADSFSGEDVAGNEFVSDGQVYLVWLEES